VPKSLTTTVAVTPFAFAQGAIADRTVGALPESAQIKRFFVAACAGATKLERTRAAVAMAPVTPRRFLFINFLHGSFYSKVLQRALFNPSMSTSQGSIQAIFQEKNGLLICYKFFFLQAHFHKS
jgi:hypothetical protein